MIFLGIQNLQTIPDLLLDRGHLEWISVSSFNLVSGYAKLHSFLEVADSIDF